MKKLYKEAQDRLEYLQSQEQTDEVKHRIMEANLFIVKIQQELLANGDGRYYTYREIEIIKSECYEDGYEEGQFDN